MRSYSFAKVLTVCLVLAASVPGLGQTFFKEPNNNTLPDGINDLGIIVGHLGDESGGKIGFIRRHSGHFTMFLANHPDCPGALGSTWPTGINRRGDVVGRVYCAYEDNIGMAHGFLRQRDGTIIPLQDPEGNWAYATAINDYGFIVGSVQRPSGEVVGFIRSNKGDYAYLPKPPNVQISPLGINNEGTIVGRYAILDPSTGYQTSQLGFIYRNGAYQTFDFGPYTDFVAIANGTEDVLVSASVPETGGQPRSYWVRHKNGTTVSLNGQLSSLNFRAFTGLNRLRTVVGFYLPDFQTVVGLELKRAY